MPDTLHATVHVLIADPDPIGRSACRKLVASRGLIVAEAASRALAVRWLEQVEPRLLILDLALTPDLDLLKQVVSLFPKVDVVLMCPEPRLAPLRDQVRALSLSAYVRDLWGKPLQPERVAGLLKRIFAL